MKLSITCPKCQTTKTIKYSLSLYIFLWFTLIGGIIYTIIIASKFKCPKCKTMMENNNTIQTPKDQFIEIEKFKKNHKDNLKNKQ